MLKQTLKTIPKTLNFERTVRKFGTLTQESLLLSCDNDQVHNSGKFSLLLKMRIEDKIMMDMASDFERANEVDRDLDPFICKQERGGYVKDDLCIIILIFKSGQVVIVILENTTRLTKKQRGNSHTGISWTFENAAFSSFC